ncbi:MAG: hypothetical protein HZA51_10485 [Planctomycetes bacterium]|nr:hypothetical protein [Planctomycetota bacterium]
MTLAGRDLFELYRLVLTTICTIYALVVTSRSLWGWLEYFSAPDKVTGVMRRYAIASLLRMRWRRFSWEFVQIGLWAAALLLVLNLHRVLGIRG